MEHSWRTRSQMDNFCPVCSNSHFPFCPPPLPQYFRPPPPPPAQHSDQFFHHHLPPPPPHPPTPPPPPPPMPYDPFVDHQCPPTVNPYPPPPPSQLLPRPWNNNPNFSDDSYVNLNTRLEYDNGQMIGAKRMRFDNSSLNLGPGTYMNNSYGSSSVEDERRLKLIRDHGAVNLDIDRKYEWGSNFSANCFETRNSFEGYFKGNSLESNPHEKQNYEYQFRHEENIKNVDLGRSPHDQSERNLMRSHVNKNSGYRADAYNRFEQDSGNHQKPVYSTLPYRGERSKFPTESHEFDNDFLQRHAMQHQAMESKQGYYSLSNPSEKVGSVQPSLGYEGQPPLPTSPPPPLPVELPDSHFTEPVVSSSATGAGSLFRFPVDSASSLQSSYAADCEAISLSSVQYSNKANSNSSGYYTEEIQAFQMAPPKTYLGENEVFPSQHLLSEKPKVFDASHILKKPHRAGRPDHIVIILRGLPGSGKSYLAKMLRDLEVENGGSAPRIHSMDDYFMTEVEKVEESEGPKSTSSVRGKKPVMKKVMEYCYEPEMEEAYRSSMLKAFKKTLDEGVFSFVIVDDRNLRVADFAQFWATAKRSGYEVYLLEATYKDPVGCAARNVHGFTQHDIQKMANQWEEAPSLYMMLDIKSLLHRDDLEENGIQEVDMDTEDGDHIGDLSRSEDADVEKIIRPSKGPANNEHKWDVAEREHPIEVVSELGKSKWSNDLDEDEVQKSKVTRGNTTALSGLVKSYSKQGKSVRWADQVGSIGFSIGAGRAAKVSLIIGAGSGYNLKSNPLPEEEKLALRNGGLKRPNIFQEQLRAEREAFRAVFDRKRQRIGGFDLDEE